MAPLVVTLRSLRKSAGLTQAQLAERASVRQATVSAIERGSDSISLDVLDRLCLALSKALKRPVLPGELFERVTTTKKQAK